MRKEVTSKTLEIVERDNLLEKSENGKYICPNCHKELFNIPEDINLIKDDLIKEIVHKDFKNYGYPFYCPNCGGSINCCGSFGLAEIIKMLDSGYTSSVGSYELEKACKIAGISFPEKLLSDWFTENAIEIIEEVDEPEVKKVVQLLIDNQEKMKKEIRPKLGYTILPCEILGHDALKLSDKDLPFRDDLLGQRKLIIQRNRLKKSDISNTYKDLSQSKPDKAEVKAITASNINHLKAKVGYSATENQNLNSMEIIEIPYYYDQNGNRITDYSVSDAIINAKTAEFIESSGYLERDGSGKGFVCPECGSGAGPHGTGLSLDKKDGLYMCWPEHKKRNLVGLIQAKEQLDYTEANKKAFEYLNLQIKYVNTQTAKYSQNSPKNAHINDFNANTINYINNQEKREYEQNTGKIEQSKPELDQEIIDLLSEKKHSRKDLIKGFIDALEAERPLEYIQQKRGISLKTAKHYKLGYIEYFEEDYQNQEGKAKKQIIKDSICFPTSLEGFASRSISANKIKGQKDKRFQKLHDTKDLPLGIKNIIEHKDKKRKDRNLLEPVFAVEGFFDAPSIFEVGGDAIALNGTGNINLIIQIFEYYQIKRPLIISFDNDKSGNLAKENAIKLLENSDINYFITQLVPEELAESGIKDVNELLLYDKELLKEIINNSKDLPFQEYEKKLNKNQEEQFFAFIEDTLERKAINTGFKLLDSKNYLDGGLYSGLYTIGAISSLGKTTFSLQIADQIAKAGNDVIFISLEMSANELRGKSVSRYTALTPVVGYTNKQGFLKSYREITDKSRFRYKEPKIAEEEQKHINNSIKHYFSDTGNNLRIVEGLGTIDADNIESIVKEHIEQTGNKPVVFIDYVQLLIQPKDENGKRHSMTDKQITDANIFKLKQICRDYNICIFCISSLNRESYGREGTMSSFKESGAIEYSSDVLFILERKNQGDNTQIQADKIKEGQTGIREVKLKILKNRNGKAFGEVDFRYYPKYNLFVEDATEQPNLAIVPDKNDFNLFDEDFEEIPEDRFNKYKTD